MNKLFFSTIKKALYRAAGLVVLSMVTVTASATTSLTFTDNTSPSNPFPATGGVGAQALDVNTEFRVVNATDAISGFGNKSITSLTAGIVWEFSDDANMTAVLNSEMTLGTDGSGTNGASTCSTPGVPVGIPSGAVVSPTEPGGSTGLFLNAPFFGNLFGFVAPIVGSNAANLYGPATISVDINGGAIQVNIPVAEAQWANAYFLLGRQDDGVNGTGINFVGTLTNVVPDGMGNATFDFKMVANHIIQDCEDTAGFAAQTTQWEVAGTGFAPILVSSAPSTVSGATLAATLPGTSTDDGRISAAELADATLYDVPDDIGTILPDFTTDIDGSVVDGKITQTCVGGCFAFTVTGADPSEVIELPLTSPIPDNAVYRKFINGNWLVFDETGGDKVESALGAQGDCATGAPLTYTSGLTAGNFCIRLTIADGGPNDADTAAGSIVDPGGVAVVAAEQVDILLPAESLSDAVGCSVSATPVMLIERADWIIVAAFIGLLGLLGFKRRYSEK